MGEHTLDLNSFSNSSEQIQEAPVTQEAIQEVEEIIETVVEEAEDTVESDSPKPRVRNTNTKAHELAKGHREISIAEFFEKNRHLLGFDNKRKSLLTTIKEAVDNSLDACEESEILPEINVQIIDMGNERFRVVVEDNGPGIIKVQVPKIFAKLLYGSKFHSMKQSRGQQGIGISAAALYGQLTTGKPIRITTKIHPDEPAYYCELNIDTATNKPVVTNEKEKDWYKDHGTKIELDLEAVYQKGNQSVDEYLKQTAITNPHCTIIYTNPKPEQIIFPRASDEKVKIPQEIKPHPYGIELGMLIKMLAYTESKTLQQFLMTEFSRVSANNVKQICEEAALLPTTKPGKITRDMAENLMKGIKATKLIAPSTDCISPIGEALIEKGLKKEINAEFYASVTRPANVYRGNPFIIEAGLAYGGELKSDSAIKILRYANRVPLLYQQGGCAITDSIQKTAWRPYGLNQSSGSIPQGPAVIMVHMASVWVPFTSEAKEALAHYPEIIKEIKLAIRELGRKLSSYVNKKRKVKDEFKKRSYIEKYIPHVSTALHELLDISEYQQDEIKNILKGLLESSRGKIDSMEFDAKKNTEYDAEFAKIGKEDKDDDEYDDGDLE